MASHIGQTFSTSTGEGYNIYPCILYHVCGFKHAVGKPGRLYKYYTHPWTRITREPSGRL
jgi:hypothetical protein